MHFWMNKKGQIVNAVECIKKDEEKGKDILSEILNLYYNGMGSV